MGYRDQHGVVGQYRGENVFVVGYKDLKPSAPNDHTIYAVRIDDGHQKDWLDLVQGGKFIGTMTDSGHVEIYDASRRRPYKFYTKEKQPSKPVPEYTIEKVAEPEPIKDVSTLVLNTEYGYGVYSKIVDDFFHGLDKLWDELEV
jgi:hypothetical protein